MKKVGLIYGSETGVTEEITTLIVDNWNVSDIHVMEVSQVKKNDFDTYDFLLLT